MTFRTPNKIILVEDDPLERMLTRRTLGKLKLNADIVELSDGQYLLDYLAERDTSDVCLVILDLKLPRVDGLQALRELNAQHYTKKFPVVIMSSSGLERDVSAAYANGARAYLFKPIRHEDFVEAVQGLGLFWGKYNLLPTAA